MSSTSISKRSESERDLLVRVLRPYANTIEKASKKRDAIDGRRLAWEAVTESFNASRACTRPATQSELQRLWASIKRKCREDDSLGQTQSQSYLTAVLDIVEGRTMEPMTQPPRRASKRKLHSAYRDYDDVPPDSTPPTTPTSTLSSTPHQRTPSQGTSAAGTPQAGTSAGPLADPPDPLTDPPADPLADPSADPLADPLPTAGISEAPQQKAGTCADHLPKAEPSSASGPSAAKKKKTAPKKTSMNALVNGVHSPDVIQPYGSVRKLFLVSPRIEHGRLNGSPPPPQLERQHLNQARTRSIVQNVSPISASFCLLNQNNLTGVRPPLSKAAPRWNIVPSSGMATAATTTPPNFSTGLVRLPPADASRQSPTLKGPDIVQPLLHVQPGGKLEDLYDQMLKAQIRQAEVLFELEKAYQNERIAIAKSKSKWEPSTHDAEMRSIEETNARDKAFHEAKKRNLEHKARIETACYEAEVDQREQVTEMEKALHEAKMSRVEKQIQLDQVLYGQKIKAAEAEKALYDAKMSRVQKQIQLDQDVRDVKIKIEGLLAVKKEALLEREMREARELEPLKRELIDEKLNMARAKNREVETNNRIAELKLRAIEFELSNPGTDMFADDRTPPFL